MNLELARKFFVCSKPMNCSFTPTSFSSELISSSLFCKFFGSIDVKSISLCLFVPRNLSFIVDLETLGIVVLSTSFSFSIIGWCFGLIGAIFKFCKLCFSLK